MASKPVISVKCPCCKSILEVNTEKERVISHRKGRHLKDDAKEGEDMMDVALRTHIESKDRVEDKFLKAQDNLKNQASRLDELFEDAKDKAKDVKDDPNDPFKGGKIWD
ncbi:MAG: hypothetical protein HRU14_02800 [Planctomycetes bacterium]|nr:hypothetical protein [Planctomycetota bacterium]